MNELVLTEPLASQLEGLPYPVNLRDMSGKALGFFVPAIDRSLYEVVGPEPTNEELGQIERSTEWYSSQEVLRHLEKLG
jgi:hypothetical protein